MLRKLNEIFTAWRTASKPNGEEKAIALYRNTVCSGCNHKKKKLFVYYCDLCWCPLSKKIYSKTKDSCQKDKWKW
mgnify:CR=1 FL=1